jgi:hypothetical protein
MANNWPGPDGSLRDLVKGGLADVREAIARLCVVIEEFSKLNTAHDVKLIELEMLGIQESLEELEARLIELEAHKNMAQWIARDVVLIVVVVVVVVWVMMSY